jgi:hypothetical protein
MATMDTYDMRLYAVGKGPTAMTVDAPLTGVQLGSSVTIRGTVNDNSPGTRDDALMLRFPNGVPAVSDESMSDWMLYVYKNFARPTNATGVQITLSVVDSNGNYRVIGTTTSDADGFFSYNWQPDIDGKYTLYATFAGSESYYGSRAVSAFTVEPPTATPTPMPTQVPSIADQYFIPAIVGLFIAIIICIAMVALVLLKKP